MSQEPGTPASQRPDLLNSAIESLDAAVDGLEDGASERQLRRAVRDLASGVELALKSILESEHWVLVFDNPKLARRPDYLSGNFKSAGAEECLDRIQGILGIDLSRRLQAINDLRTRRNRMEHLGDIGSVEALRPVAAKALEAVWSILVQRFGKQRIEARGGRELADLMKRLTNLRAFVKSRMAALKTQLAMHVAVKCPSCSQRAGVVGEADFLCLFCHHQTSPSDDGEFSTFILGLVSDSKFVAERMRNLASSLTSSAVDCPYCKLPAGVVSERFECRFCFGIVEPEDDQFAQLLAGFASNADFVRERMDGLAAQLSNVSPLECPRCGQQAGVINDGLVCLFCRVELLPEEAAEEFVEVVLGVSEYALVKDGGTWPVHDCPDCETEAMVQFDEGGLRCFSCDAEYAAGGYTYCDSCSRVMTAAEASSICSRCFGDKCARD